MTQVQMEFLKILRGALRGQMEPVAVSSELLNYAHSHHLDHILGFCSDDPTCKKILENYLARNMTQVYAAEEIQEACEECGIDLLPLKGICTRERYANPDLRSMGDLDILYRPEQGKTLRSCLADLGFTWLGESQKHDHYVRKPYLSVEMHHEIVLAESDYADYYQTIWDRCVQKPGRKHIYEMKVEDELIFHMVHLTNHFRKGGVGIRLILDVFVYHQWDMDRTYVQNELQKLGLLPFYQRISELAERWFGDEELSDDPVVSQLEDFILNSGLYGSSEHAADLIASEGRIQYLWKVCFPGLAKMQYDYLWLKKYPVLLPLAWVLRGLRVLTIQREKLHSQMQLTISGDHDRGEELRRLFEACGLK